MTQFKLEQKVRVTNLAAMYLHAQNFADKCGLTKYSDGMGNVEVGFEGVVIALGKYVLTDSRPLVAVRIGERDFIFEGTGLELIQTPSEKAGFIVGENYFVKKSSCASLNNDVVQFVFDDGTSRPKFYLPARDAYVYPDVSEVSEISKNTIIKFDKVLTQAQIDAIKVLVA